MTHVHVPKPSDEATIIGILLDESGSMAPTKEHTVAKINEYLAEQRKVPGLAYLTLAKFDGFSSGWNGISFVTTHGVLRYTLLRNDEELCEVRSLGQEEYRPSGSTPLNDAVVRTVRHLEMVSARHGIKKVIFIILTDGEENASIEYQSKAHVRALIEQKQGEGWVVQFLGANINAWHEAQQYGILLSQSLTKSYKDAHSVGETWNAISASHEQYRSTGSTTLNPTNQV